MSDATSSANGGEFTYALLRLNRDARLPANDFAADVEDLLTLVAFAAYLGSEDDDADFIVNQDALDDLMIEYAHYGSPLEIDLIALAQAANDLLNGYGPLIAVLGTVGLSWKNYEEGRSARWDANAKKYDLKKRKREDAAEALRHAGSNLPADARTYEKAARAIDSGKSKGKLLRAIDKTTETDFRMKVGRGGVDVRFRRRRRSIDPLSDHFFYVDPWDDDPDTDMM